MKPSASLMEMTWLSPTHLEVTYKGNASLNFQAVKCTGIDTSVRDLSTETVVTPVNP
jgi:hypothetical protein